MSQYARVKHVLERASRPLALHEIHEAIRLKYQAFDAETAISARIRDIRHDLEREGKTIFSCRAGHGKAHHIYQIVHSNA